MFGQQIPSIEETFQLDSRPGTLIVVMVVEEKIRGHSGRFWLSA
jgi:hypothetical protein